MEITAAGTVRDFHPVPFYVQTSHEARTTISMQKYAIILCIGINVT